MQKQAIRKITIVGGGTAGWMCAAALSRMLGDKTVKIVLVESDAIGTVGVGEATIPNIATFNSMLGIDEADFMARTQGTFKLGIEFVDWGKLGDRYIHPFGPHGADMDGIYFHQFYLAARTHGLSTSIEDFSLSALAARANKFIHPKSDPRSVLSRLAYAYHFDASLYAAYLRDFAEQRGVARIEGKVINVQQSPANGFIETITLEDGQHIDGDLFIDCSGFRALLIGETLGVSYEDWSHWLPCNAAQAVPCERQGPLLPYTRATARDAGWQWRIPTRHRTGNGHVYSSDFVRDEDAARTLLDNLDGPALGEPRQLRFITGRRKVLWEKNVLSLGLSGGFLEPLESTSIYLIQAGISRFLALFPDKQMADIDRREYNRLMHLEFDQIRDFLILHYKATSRQDTEFWQYCKNMAIPESLQHKIDLFQNRGRFFRYEGDIFSLSSWVAVLMGQNIIPNGYDPIIDTLPQTVVKNSLAGMKQTMTQAVNNMPDHQQYIEDFCQKAAR